MSGSVSRQQLDDAEGGTGDFARLAYDVLDERDNLLIERDKLKEQVKVFESGAIEDREKIDDLETTMRDVFDWFDNVITHNRPMTDPRDPWRKLERALKA